MYYHLKDFRLPHSIRSLAFGFLLSSWEIYGSWEFRKFEKRRGADTLCLDRMGGVGSGVTKCIHKIDEI
jgi:hypothetical protein